MITFFLGKPGCGKTTALVRLAYKALRKKRPVFTNFFVKGCYQLTKEDYGQFEFPTNALLLIDEITLWFDSRRFKDFNDQQIQYTVLHRHYENEIVYATQYYQNVDKRIRDLTQETYLVRKLPFGLSQCLLIPPSVKIPEETGEIIIGFKMPQRLVSLFSGWYLRHKYYKYFDSWDKPELPQKSWNRW
jgi:zona occludens toxin (predicted ATPase)